jgi:hypothetical protein
VRLKKKVNRFQKNQKNWKIKFLMMRNLTKKKKRKQK